MIGEILCSCGLRTGRITTSCVCMEGDIILQSLIVDEDFVDFLQLWS